MSMIPPKIPVKVVFRKAQNPFEGGLTGPLADKIIKEIAVPIYGVMPYLPIGPAGDRSKADNLVRVFILYPDGGQEEAATDYTTLIQRTNPASPDEYAKLKLALENHGFEVEAIKATNINHDARKSIDIEKVRDIVREALEEGAKALSDAAADIQSEPIEINFDVVNDDLESSGGVGSESFTEEWA